MMVYKMESTMGEKRVDERNEFVSLIILDGRKYNDGLKWQGNVAIGIPAEIGF